jgi:hypothetical protein
MEEIMTKKQHEIFIEQEKLQKEKDTIDACIQLRKTFIHQFNESIKNHGLTEYERMSPFNKNLYKNYDIISVDSWFWTSTKHCGNNSVEKMMNNLPEFKRLKDSMVVIDNVKHPRMNFKFI